MIITPGPYQRVQAARHHLQGLQKPQQIACQSTAGSDGAHQLQAFGLAGRGGCAASQGSTCPVSSYQRLLGWVPQHDVPLSRRPLGRLHTVTYRGFICGFVVDWKPMLTYATFGCKNLAGCF